MALKIGSIKLSNPFILAPMHGVNCLAFMQICKEYGAGLVYSPMIHINWLEKEGKLPAQFEFSADKNKKSNKNKDNNNSERPLTVQLIGNDPKKVKKAIEIIEPYADIIDFNFGCPDNDVSELKMGAYLMKQPEKIWKIINAATCATKTPITAKIRLGWDDEHINYLDVAKKIEDAGASAIALHARTREQRYSEKADWSAIKKLKEHVNIPVIGNGDVDSGRKAVEMLTSTGCDFVMIGRAAMGYPLIFRECNYALERKKGNEGERGKEFAQHHEYTPSLDERHAALTRFIELFEKSRQKDDIASLREYIMWSLKGLAGAKSARAKLMKMKDAAEVKRIAEEYFC